ncbi:murein DD-endopeptidase MepM/ murein hydrolase activator NlpD [Microbacterium halimionae]|uniref:Murein DD-endopeptidase MepM/ murein hydrolase activator NlpD n=1 Tax=Microbacterium halimionae TaxID=1526413 RepID=A0A7W3JRI6_9MICO|nr:peptidoglycan DD-metalloendopeptidase family protein [Microbacterium halimionae]MBA8817684.1 murein DD-endopeptidase MepM/ murein hydrolase activator NlpD [Microbacterium halimionae]NII94557.1 murein DD-endopeptidase MepM/ murein hydrolase activator NlpD [Microbacterium halimionae]
MQTEDDDCGCAPTESESRAFWPKSVSRRRALSLGALGVVALGAAGSLGVASIPSAYAADYPSWDDVQAAKANESAKASQVSRIQGLIQQLNADVERTAAEAQAASDAFFQAQQEFFDAAKRADDLQSQADEQAAAALDAANKAGRVAAQLYRSGGDDTALELFFAGSAASADDLLSRLGTMDKLLERNQAVYSDATTARDAAQGLSDQAKEARAARDELQKAAEAAMLESQQAADAAAAALAAQQENLGTLQAQLSALQDKTASTVAEYQEGERVRKAEEERKRREAEAAAAAAAAAAAEAERKRREAEAAAQQNSGGGGGGGGGSSGGGGGGGGGGSSSSGGAWRRPSDGYISSGYGPRTVQCGSGYCSSGYHYGVDFAPGCSAPIYAASAGTVVYAGYNGGYGYYVKIDHGNGTGTGYGHIREGGIFVGYGQQVSAGQVIASVGNTGNSFGCHVHFETYVYGAAVNPYGFMSARGVNI